MGYIYLLQEREFINAVSNVCKVGRTMDVIKRFKQYPKGSKLLWCVYTTDCVDAERKAIKMLGDRFQPRRDIGNESFEGDISLMVILLQNLMNAIIQVTPPITHPIIPPIIPPIIHHVPEEVEEVARILHGDPQRTIPNAPNLQHQRTSSTSSYHCMRKRGHLTKSQGSSERSHVFKISRTCLRTS